jgi:signal transduction histidine kinase
MTETIHFLFSGILLSALIWQIRENRLLKKDIFLKAAEWKQAVQTKNKMMTTLSHEVLTPLRVISFVARREVQGASLPDSVRESLEKIGRTADMLYQTSLNVVSWMKYQENGDALKGEKVFPAEVAGKAADILSHMAEEKSDKVLNRIPTGMYLYTDKTILQIILLNLLSNAIKFTAGGKIILEGAYGEDGVNILVRDTGTGFPQEVLEQLQRSSGEHFSTVGTHAEPGHGVGYTIIIHFLKLLGGSLEIHSRPGEGASILITLPKKRYL